MYIRMETFEKYIPGDDFKTIKLDNAIRIIDHGEWDSITYWIIYVAEE